MKLYPYVLHKLFAILKLFSLMYFDSFSIILYEIQLPPSLRCISSYEEECHGTRPFGMTDLSPRDVIRRIVMPTDGYFRPRMESLENCFDFVTNCLELCWSENPEERPDFKVNGLLLACHTNTQNIYVYYHIHLFK